MKKLTIFYLLSIILISISQAFPTDTNTDIIKLGHFRLNNKPDIKWKFSKNNDSVTLRHDDNFSGSITYINNSDESSTDKIISTFKNQYASINTEFFLDENMNLGENSFRHLALQNDNNSAHLFITAKDKEILALMISVTLNEIQEVVKFMDLLSNIKHTQEQAENQASPTNNSESLILGSFKLLNVSGNSWAFVKDEEGIKLFHTDGFRAYISYEAGNVQEIIEKNKTSVLQMYSSVGAEIKSQSDKQLGNNKFSIFTITGNEETVYLYILVNKNDVLSFYFSISKQSTSISDFEILMSVISIIEEQPVAAINSNNSSTTQQPGTNFNPPTDNQQQQQEPEQTTNQSDTQSTPPQIISGQPKQNAKNLALFRVPIYLTDYRIKIGMNLPQIKKITSGDKLTEISQNDIYKMNIYKFKLLKYNNENIDGYAKAYSELNGIKIFTLKHIDQILLLFFYNKILYSIKIREENISIKNFNLIVKPLLRNFRGIKYKTNYGIKYKAKLKGRSIIECNYFSLDKSSEITIYNKDLVRKIEKKISR